MIKATDEAGVPRKGAGCSGLPDSLHNKRLCFPVRLDYERLAAYPVVLGSSFEPCESISSRARILTARKAPSSRGSLRPSEAPSSHVRLHPAVRGSIQRGIFQPCKPCAEHLHWEVRLFPAFSLLHLASSLRSLGGVEAL